MNRLVLLLVLATAFSVRAGQIVFESKPARAHLIELYTSEGCSSCLPAEEWMSGLKNQPRLWQDIVPVAFHVDYWDHLGWRDPFSSHANTVRQEAYARHLGTQGPYTPQMVIDGAVEFNGADGRRAQEEIARAATRERTAVRVTRNGAGIRIEIDAAPRAAYVMLAVAQDAGDSQVKGGENNGRRLQHVAILKSLRKVAQVKKGAG
ncbi:MAG TPA: DUF1223 domain-containing protein, partial [Chthoniobacterales bacterium]|nr:DUF1223 domain-containing protein [Chthoniobacterales bacterium]